MRPSVSMAIASVLLGAAASAHATDARRSDFDTMPDGRAVPAVTLTNGNGVSATIIAYGATLQSMVLPDGEGKSADVALGHLKVADYIDKRQYFGTSVGRVANRIAKGQFVLDGKRYQTPLNDGPNMLHGGLKGFDRAVWEIVEVKADKLAAFVRLRHVSPAGDQGFPGKLVVTATYTLDEANALTIVYEATTDKTTVANITNHAYWNLAGEGSPLGAMGHVMTIPADTYLPVDATLIPTGEMRSVEGSVFDFQKPMPVGDRVRDASEQQLVYGRGYDHNWVIGRGVTPDLHLMAKVSEPVSGRGFELWSNQPGLQFYSGNFLDGTSSGKSNRIYRGGDAIVLEPQLFPDTVNQPAFGSALLAPGATYRNVMAYRFTWRGPTAVPAKQ